jgi:hypothetical protein
MEGAQDLDHSGSRFNRAMASLPEHRFEDAKRNLHQSIASHTAVLASHLMLGVAAMAGKITRSQRAVRLVCQNSSFPCGGLDQAPAVYRLGRNGEKIRVRIACQSAMAGVWVGARDAAFDEFEAREGANSLQRFAAMEKDGGEVGSPGQAKAYPTNPWCCS